MKILPATAKASAERQAVTVQLGTKDSKVLRNIRKRIKEVGGPTITNARVQRAYLAKALSSASAIWTLCHLMLPWHPEKNHETCLEAAHCNSGVLFTVEAYVVDVYSDHTATDQEGANVSHVLFTLTKTTILELTEYYGRVHLMDMSQHYGLAHDDQAKAKAEYQRSLAGFLFSPPIDVLEGLEEDGTGELLGSWSAAVKDRLLELFDIPTLHFLQTSRAHPPELCNENIATPAHYQSQPSLDCSVSNFVPTSYVSTSLDCFSPSTLIPFNLELQLHSTPIFFAPSASPEFVTTNLDPGSTTPGSLYSFHTPAAMQVLPWPSMVAAQKNSQRLET